MIKLTNYKNEKGFTFSEIIAGALIITISVSGTYSVYVVARRFAERFKHKIMATSRASEIADQLRYRNSYDAASLSFGDHAIPPGEITKWTLCDEVKGLNAGYTVSKVWFDKGEETGEDPQSGTPAFKKVIVRIGWKERG